MELVGIALLFIVLALLAALPLVVLLHSAGSPSTPRSERGATP